MLEVEKLINQETDVEVLKVWCKHSNNRIAQLEDYIKDLHQKIAQESQAKLALDVELVKLKRLMFQGGREKNQLQVNEQKQQELVIDRKRQKQDKALLLHSQSLIGPGSQKQSKNLQEQVIVHEVTALELERVCQEYALPYNKADWEEVKGLADKSFEITVIERRYIKQVHHKKKLRYIPSKDQSRFDKEIIVTANGSDKLLPGSGYSIDFALSVVGDKYEYHLPLERQRRKMESAGLREMSVKTLYNLCFTVAQYMEGVSQAIKQDIFTTPLAVCCDETPWPISGNKDSDGYMWSIANQAGCYYAYEPSRSGQVIEAMLQGYQGPIMCDGFSGYNRLKKDGQRQVANCWSHVRRKFYDIRAFHPEEAQQILSLIDELFAIERKAQDWDVLLKLRQEESTPQIEKIRQWLLGQHHRHLPQSAMVKAIEYALKLWPGLTLFLKQVSVPLSNNEAERTLRHAVMGRKNFNGSKTINGADTAATLYSVIESCKRAELNAIAYMRYVITTQLSGELPLTPLNYAKKLNQHKN